MGTHHYGIELPAATRIVQNLAPEEGEGPLRAVPHDQLTVGIYSVNETDASTLPPELGKVFVDFEQQINAAEAQGKFADARAVMIVEDWQADLKRVTLRLIWTDPDSEEEEPEPITHEQAIYLHRERPRRSTGTGG
jgi:hypothetical protein